MNLDLTAKPLVVATVTQQSDLDYLQGGSPIAADVLEFRLDDLSPCSEAAIAAMQATGQPSLVTVRRPDEGGSHSLSDEQRIAIYEEALADSALVDTEIASLSSPAFSRFVTTVHESDARLVASYHDFNRFPGIDTLREKVEQAYDLEADIAKVAVVMESMEDLFRLAKLVETQRSAGRHISAMGMGPLGKISRLVLAKAGSCLNYGYLQTSNAPGQWSAEELSHLIEEI